MKVKCIEDTFWLQKDKTFEVESIKTHPSILGEPEQELVKLKDYPRWIKLCVLEIIQEQDG